jgi:hypothetical protein
MFGLESCGLANGSDEKGSAPHAPREGRLSKTPTVCVYTLSFPRPVDLRAHGPEVRKARAELLEHPPHNSGVGLENFIRRVVKAIDLMEEKIVSSTLPIGNQCCFPSDRECRNF